MLKRRLAAIASLLAAACLAFAAAARAEVAIPALSARVTDLTGTLTAEQKGALEQRLAAFEKRKGSQVAVLMLPTTQPESIEQFSIRLAEAWKIGRKGTDDGVILVVAKDDRRLRIEVGYGLEGAIPDAMAKRIVSEAITPRFKSGDFYGGLSAGVDWLVKLIDGEKLPAPSASPPSPGGGEPDPNDWIVPAFFFLFIGGAILRSILGRLRGATVMAMLGGVAGAYLFGIFGAVVAAIVAFIVTLMNFGTSFGSSGGSTSSGSSSSWGGGGGSFGGGGSSGSW